MSSNYNNRLRTEVVVPYVLVGRGLAPAEVRISKTGLAVKNAACPVIFL